MKHIHFLGIGGSGASAVAAIAKSQGYQISGCDKNPHNEFTSQFDQEILWEGHSLDHLKDVDIAAVTPAIFSLDPNNPELIEAKRRQIQVITWQEFMGQYLEKDKYVIAICGTHGKSTTTAMIGLMMEEAGLDPTVELGAIVPKWRANYRIGQSKYFVTEADEFNNNFLVSHPNLTVVTNMEWDHPEFFKNFEDYKASFEKFFSQTKGQVIQDVPPVKFDLQVLGKYNQQNAGLAFKVGQLLDIPENIIQKSLQAYSGIGKRLEKLGHYKGATFYSDFGHHPTEIKVTMEAVRQKYPNAKIWLIFQPHMFSRTKALFNDFVKVFQELPVDHIYIADIYPSREVDTGIVNSKQLIEAIHKPSVKYLADPETMTDVLKQELVESDIVVFQGATDIDKIGKKLLVPSYY